MDRESAEKLCEAMTSLIVGNKLKMDQLFVGKHALDKVDHTLAKLAQESLHLCPKRLCPGQGMHRTGFVSHGEVAAVWLVGRW